MDDNVVDSLRIEVVGDSSKAIGGIGKLISTLEKLNTITGSASKAGDGLSEKLKKISDTANGSAKLQSTLSGVTKTIAGSNSEVAKLEKDLDKALFKLDGYFKELDNIQSVTDKMLEQCASSEQVNHLLEVEQTEIERLNKKYSHRLSIVQEIQEKLKEVSGMELKTNEGKGHLKEFFKTTKSALSSIGSLAKTAFGKLNNLFIMFKKRALYRTINAVISGVAILVRNIRADSVRKSVQKQSQAVCLYWLLHQVERLSEAVRQTCA